MDATLLLKASVLFALSLLAARLLRRAPAGSRHRLWSLAFAAVLALPLLSPVLPAVDLPVLPGRGAPAAGATTHAPDPLAAPAPAREAATMADGTRTPRPGAAPAPAPAPATATTSPPDRTPSASFPAGWSASSIASALLLVVWLAGTIAAAAMLLLSLVRVRGLARGAQDVDDPAWRDAADALGARLALRRPARLLLSPDVSTPMAGGVWRPIVFLPASARAWSAEQRDVVLAHEIAHLAGRDPLRHLAARLAVAVYWFHPLAWMAARHATVAREQACDETVLALGTRPSAYARVLLDLADALHPSAPAAAALGALPMVERSLLETRLMAILDDDPLPTHRRPATRRRLLIPAIGVALLTLSVAAARPVARAADTKVEAEAVPPVAVAAAVAQPDASRGSACWWDLSDGRSFRGNVSSSDVDGRTIIHERIGTHGTDRLLQKAFGDVRLCMVAEDVGRRGDAGARDRTDRPSQWLARASRVVMEASRGTAPAQRLVIAREAGGGQRTTWQVAGAERPFDAAAQQWRDRMLAALDTTWELATLRGEVSSLRGEISSIRGQESSLRGQISSLRGEVSSMRGRASSIRGEESSLRGRISSIRGHLSSLRGQISSERGAISSLNAGGYRGDRGGSDRISAEITRHDAEIARIEQEIREFDADAKVAAVEREITALDGSGKVDGVDAEIRAFDLDGKVKKVEGEIAALDVKGKVAAIEGRIAALDADRRGRQLEARRKGELAQLEAAIAAIR